MTGHLAPKMDADVTVVLLTHNRGDDVCRTIDRLLVLPEAPPVIVVDNASTDGTLGLISKRFSTVEVVSLGKNLGAAGRNVGLRHARTAYVALCDDDTWWSPGSLAHAVTLLQAHPQLAVVTARVLVGVEQREDPTCAKMAISPLGSAGQLPGYPILGFLAGASVVRRSAVLEAGGFHPRLFLGGEEALLACDLASRGWAMAYVPKLVVHHHPSPRRDVRRRQRLLLRNALWLAWLRRPLGSALRQTCRLLIAAMRKPHLWPSLTQALCGVSWIVRERRVIPRQLETALRRLEARERLPQTAPGQPAGQKVAL